jgi:uncharacterized membrane protein YjgN (DUF898 family)
MSVAAGDPTIHPFSQRATFANLTPLALKNAILGLLTLTLYRFWARTDVRRRLWSTTYVMGDPLEYTGDGWELFRGFLITIPVFFLPAIFVLYVAPLVMAPATAALLLFAFYAIAVPLIAAAIYLMRRYQLSRTRWRGIRLALDGSASTYALASTGWTLLEIVTFGWYAPAARMRRAKLIWENTRFGDQPFEFGEGEQQPAKGLTGPYALAWFGVPIAFIVASVFTGIVMVLTAGAFGVDLSAPQPAPQPDAPPSLFMFAMPIVFLIFLALAWAFMWMPYNAAAMNRTAELLSLDGARFRLRTRTVALYGVTLASVLIFILSLGLLAPLSGMIHMRYVLNRLEMVGAPRFADIGQSVIAAPRSGEGFADAFDLDFGVGVI